MHPTNQAILTWGMASERNFPIKSGLANMRNYFFATKKKHRKWFLRQNYLFADFLYLFDSRQFVQQCSY